MIIEENLYKHPFGYSVGSNGDPSATSSDDAPAVCAATIILPAFNEAEALPHVLAALYATIDASYEVIVVDDASSDETAAIASEFPCRIVRHPVNQGKGAAVRTGIAHASGDFVIVMDADNTYPADAVPRIMAAAKEYDFVRCTRDHGLTHMPLLNRLGNRFFDFILRSLHGLEGTDHLTGLYGLRRDSLAAMMLTSDRFDLEVEIGIKARAHGLRAISFPIHYNERLGEKKLHAWRDGWHILRRALSMSFRNRPLSRALFNTGSASVAPDAYGSETGEFLPDAK